MPAAFAAIRILTVEPVLFGRPERQSGWGGLGGEIASSRGIKASRLGQGQQQFWRHHQMV